YFPYRKSLKYQLKLNRYDGYNTLDFELSIPKKIFSLHWEHRVLYHVTGLGTLFLWAKKENLEDLQRQNKP
ncbi:hypothetical protein BpHYR1_052992, partial [Brachionus plicatilis]